MGLDPSVVSGESRTVISVITSLAELPPLTFICLPFLVERQSVAPNLEKPEVPSQITMAKSDADLILECLKHIDRAVTVSLICLLSYTT